ncbi:MAG: ATP-grasp domain-containing protein [Promethearchaeota archaeon]
MKIGILSKRTTGFTGNMVKFLENNGHDPKIYLLEKFSIDESLFENDYYILKSKKLIYLYAGLYLKENNIPVYPDPELTYKHKNRIEAHFLIKKAGLLCPDYIYGSVKTLKERLKPIEYPLIVKPIMGSGSRGVKKIYNVEDFKEEKNKLLYMERYIKGTHYLVYFINDDICTVEKPPLSNEHVDMKEVPTTNEIRKVIEKWKNYYNLFFGHLYIVIETSTNIIYVVDPGI